MCSPKENLLGSYNWRCNQQLYNRFGRVFVDLKTKERKEEAKKRLGVSEITYLIVGTLMPMGPERQGIMQQQSNGGPVSLL